MRKLYAVLLLLSLVALTEQAGAVLYKGSISESSGFILHGNWSHFTLSWEVEKNDVSSSWVYRYTFSVATPDISYAILEVSENTTLSDFAFSPRSPAEGPQSFSYQNNSSTPYWPDELSIFGLKWNGFIPQDGKYDDIFITTERAPMWGDLYAKGGTNQNPDAQLGVAYNKGFGDTTIDRYDLNLDPQTIGKIMVPNKTSTMVPEPATMLLLGFGLMGMAFIGRRKFRK